MMPARWYNFTRKLVLKMDPGPSVFAVPVRAVSAVMGLFISFVSGWGEHLPEAGGHKNHDALARLVPEGGEQKQCCARHQGGDGEPMSQHAGGFQHGGKC